MIKIFKKLFFPESLSRDEEGTKTSIKRNGGNVSHPLNASNVIICRINGGLGNQMICYKVGRYLADLKNWALFLDVSPYEKLNRNSNRNLQLQNFDIRYNMIIYDKEILLNLKENNSIYYVSGAKFKEFKKETLKDLAINIIKECRDNIYVDLWTGLLLRDVVDKYFENGFLNELRIDRAKHFSERDMCYLELTRNEESVAVHVRRGDFKTHAGNLLVSKRFYNDAIVKLENDLENPKFFVFSDDIEWCRKNLETKNKIYFIDHNDENKAFIDLSLASACRHFILSNESTFSHHIYELREIREKNIVIRSKKTDLEIYKN